MSSRGQVNGITAAAVLSLAAGAGRAMAQAQAPTPEPGSSANSPTQPSTELSKAYAHDMHMDHRMDIHELEREAKSGENTRSGNSPIRPFLR